MLKHLILIALLVYAQNSLALTSISNITSNLEAATTYHEYMEQTVEPAILETLKSYKENPAELCKSLAELPEGELIYLSEVMDAVKSEIPCATDASLRIQNFYKNYADISFLSMQDKLYKKLKGTGIYKNDFPLPAVIKSDKIILDKAYSLPTEKQLPNKVINLTFDDGPHEVNTEKILNILDGYGIKANFFVLGKNAQRYPTIIKETASRGHSIGGHSMTHASLNKLKFENATKEIMGVLDVVEKLLSGVDPFFRFPYGARTKSLRNYLAQNNISDFFWNVDTLDWKYKDPSVLLKYALNQTTNTGRGIVLFHDIQPQTAAILPAYLDALANLGYSTVVYEPQ